MRIEAACAERGKPVVVAACLDLLAGNDVDPALLDVLGGPAAHHRVPAYWYRTWAVRGLMWAWDDSALPVLRATAHDPAWRVRELTAKVVARNLLGDLMPEVERLRRDPVLRVRTAATRAVAKVIAANA